MNGKKDSLNLQKFIISIVIIGVVLVIGIYITDSIADVTTASNTAGNILNESVTFDVLNTPQSLAAAPLSGVSCNSIDALTNASAVGTVLLSGNVTLTSDCTLLNTSAINVDPAASTVFISYSYTYTADTDASNAAEDVVDALATGTSWISILVVVGFAVIILTMLTSGLGMAARREEYGTPYY